MIVLPAYGFEDEGNGVVGLLDFRPLFGVQNVFQQKGMDAKGLADAAHGADVV